MTARVRGLALPLRLRGHRAALVAIRHRAEVRDAAGRHEQCQPLVPVALPLPRALWDKGIRRYGFHGLSVQSAA